MKISEILLKLKLLIPSIEKKIVSFIPHDKALHLIAGIIIGGLLGVISPLLSLIIISAIAILKEIADKELSTGTPDTNDALFTIAGGSIGIILILISKLF